MKGLIFRIRWQLLGIALLTGLFAASCSLPAYAESLVWEIYNFEQLMDAVQESKADSFVKPKRTIVLMNDIVLTEQNKIDLASGVYDNAYGKIRTVTFGQQNKKFGGVFDGQGHTISGMVYDAEELGYAADTGLFSYTDGAVIKNLIIENADLDADYRGGIIAGSSDNTLFENITVRNSHLRVSCSNNVLTLVTDGGLSGGAIVGEALNCILYDCEAYETKVSNNNTAGVAALGGKGLYLGGLAGTADEGTLIEYSRVIGGEVTSYYDVAVGALGGNTLYVGGIAGQLQKGSKVADCFSTADLYYYTATYVSIGAGNSGHIGGIAAAVYGDSCQIERCHYAGTPTSKQYNAILVIPIIQENINLSGIVDKWNPGSVTVSYFRESVTGEIDTLGDKKSTELYGPLSDEQYIDRDFWQSKGYDFLGMTERSTKYSSFHKNLWVMDEELGIPVHGQLEDGVIHIKKIVKNGIGTGSSLITITDTADSGKSITVAVRESTEKEESIVLVKVPYGSYTVSKNPAWDWREDQMEEQTVTISAITPETVCVFEGEKMREQWLSSETGIQNEFRTD